MIFDGWGDFGRLLAVGVPAYAALVIVLRASGKRTLSKMNAFDLVVTVALGSTLASVLLDGRVTLVQGIAAFALLAAMQFAVAFASARSRRFERLVKAEPTLVLHRGRMLHAALKAERLTEDEVLAAVRAQGIASLAAVEAAVLETDGTLSVVASPGSRPADALRLVRGAGVPPATRTDIGNRTVERRSGQAL